jgi:transcriptional regulator with XRE-family HTH domain
MRSSRRARNRKRVNAGASDLKQFLAFNMRRFRIDQGMTQSDVANAASVTRAHLNRLEHGTFNASLDTVIRLAAALRVEPLSLLKKPKE